MTLPKMNEEAVYQAFLDKELEIDSNGQIWRIACRRGTGVPGVTRLIPCPRRRGEFGAQQEEYLRVHVGWDRKLVTAMAHRLVYRHFFGPIPQGITVNHRNGKKQDNRPENLELATYSEQALHARYVLQVGPQNYARAKLRDVDVREIRRRCLGCESQHSIAADFGVARATISRIACGLIWRSVK